MPDSFKMIMREDYTWAVEWLARKPSRDAAVNAPTWRLPTRSPAALLCLRFQPCDPCCWPPVLKPAPGKHPTCMQSNPPIGELEVAAHLQRFGAIVWCNAVAPGCCMVHLGQPEAVMAAVAALHGRSTGRSVLHVQPYSLGPVAPNGGADRCAAALACAVRIAMAQACFYPC